MGSVSQGKAKSSGGTSESALSKEQTAILKNREGLYQKHWFPAILNEFNETSGQGATAKLAATNLSNVNQAYQGAQTDISRSLAQREITGGFQGTALAGLEVARANAAAGAVNQAYGQNKQIRQGLIGMALSGSPTPTTAAAYHQSNKSSEKSMKVGIGA